MSAGTVMPAGHYNAVFQGGPKHGDSTVVKDAHRTIHVAFKCYCCRQADFTVRYGDAVYVLQGYQIEQRSPACLRTGTLWYKFTGSWPSCCTENCDAAGKYGTPHSPLWQPRNAGDFVQPGPGLTPGEAFQRNLATRQEVVQALGATTARVEYVSRLERRLEDVHAELTDYRARTQELERRLEKLADAAQA